MTLNPAALDAARDVYRDLAGDGFDALPYAIEAYLRNLPKPADGDVERVARVLCDCDPNGNGADWKEYQQDARAALSAMRPADGVIVERQYFEDLKGDEARAEKAREEVRELVEAAESLSARFDHPLNAKQHVEYFKRWPEYAAFRTALARFRE